jgi:CRISP-associated protein Cas1
MALPTHDGFLTPRQMGLCAMLDETLDEDAPSAIIASTFGRVPDTDAVVTVHGYGCKVRVVHGQLVISDGIGRHQRERRYPKADRRLQRIVVTSMDGYVTLEALQWASEHGITVAMIEPDAELTAHYATTSRATDPKLARRQVTAALDETGLAIARELLQRKVRGQADNVLKYFGDHNGAAQLYQYAERMYDATAITQRERDTASLSELEGWAARDYFSQWISHVTPQWAEQSLKRIPSNWLTYTGRSTKLVAGGRKYNASDPVNALLNYAYALGFTEARTACIGYGLNPALGYLHADKTGRDSLALDVLEAIRPEIDARVIELVGRRVFTHRDFAEPHGLEPGTVRVVAPLTHEVAELSCAWQSIAVDAVRAVAGFLTGHAGNRGSLMPNQEAHRTAFVSQLVTADDVLTEADYARLFAIVPPFVRQRRGHPPIDNRRIIAAIIHCERHHRPWAHVPESFGISYRTMTDRRRMWQRQGVWEDIHREIQNAAHQPK